MTLFLEWDTAGDHPVGFENPCLNFFDPAEDDKNDQHFNSTEINDDDNEDAECDNGSNSHSKGLEKNCGVDSIETVSLASPFGRKGTRAKARHSPRIVPTKCLCPGCKPPRFDSSFCSDGCGLRTMEKDLLCSLQYANDIHPYELRP